MMGRQQPPQGKLFQTGFNLEERIRADHPLRKVAEAVDFDFVYDEVRELYGRNGNVSVPPPVILKLMFLLVFYNVRSERELMATLPERLDWLWFLGFDLESEIPDHSVLSKARARWGAELFRRFFERIVTLCVEAGLVDGGKIFVDSSMVQADASNNSVVDTHSLKRRLSRSYVELEGRLEAAEAEGSASSGPVNDRYVSTTDPDAAIVRQGGKSKLRHQLHRAVDERHEVITATETTRGDVNEAHRLVPLVEQHRLNTGRSAGVVAAGSKYGTVDNFLACHDRGIGAHMPDLSRSSAGRLRKSGKFCEEDFQYVPDSDVYICPAGVELRPRSRHKSRAAVDYAAPGEACRTCRLRRRCTDSKQGRTVKRHLRQEELDRMRAASRGGPGKRDIRKRQHLMERSFARAKPHGYKRARWRGLWRVAIQQYLISAVQNIKILIAKAGPVGTAASQRRLPSAPGLLPWARKAVTTLLRAVIGLRRRRSLCIEAAK